MITFDANDRILVTGASSGIGKAIALQLNALGATVIASGRSQQRLEEARAVCAHPDAFFLEPLDLLADMDALPAWVRSLREQYGKLSGLVPCAGTALISPLREFDRTVANAFFDIHYTAAMLLAKGFADRRNNVGRGAAIVFIGSRAPLVAQAGLSIYAAAKGAILAATGVLSKELASVGIRVNALAPGLVKTPMAEKTYLSFLPEERRQEEIASYPFGLGEPEDVASMAVFLLSRHSKWITGQTIVLDGGRY